jgi:hypothetical protein
MPGLGRLVRTVFAILVRGPRRAARDRVRRVRLGPEEMEARVVPTLLGQRLFPSDNAWNQDISDAPVDPNSASMIGLIGTSTRVTPDWGANPNNLYQQAKLYGIPVNIVHGNGAQVSRTNVIIDNYPGESDVVAVPLPNDYAPVLEGDLPNGPNTNGPGYGENGTANQRGDSHLIVWDEDNNVAYELYGVSRPSDPNLFPNTSDVELPNPGGWHAAQETVFDMKTDTFRTIGATSADAAGLSILAGLARPDEGLPGSQGGTGVIDHALRVTLNGNQVAPAEFTYPASHMVTSPVGTVPLGARLRLQNTPAVNQLIAQMGPESQILAHAMQQYGLIVADIGSPMYITGIDQFVDNVDSGVGPLTWDEKDIFGYLTGHPAGLESLNAGDFDFVDLAPVVTGLGASAGAAGTTLTITGQNFSGAAGRLSVLFGGTPASSVTYVDDAHLTAVVPNGTGTVDVQVQSGINEVDQIDLPAHPNVTETIASGYRPSSLFGYGISATSPADRFTYTGQTVSGTNSTIDFGSPTVSSGNGDLVTLVVEDTSRAAVPGLASAAFTFSLSGGTSAGTFGPVTETATPGTYTTTFTGTHAGTASALTATITGVTLGGRPTVTVTPGAVSPSSSTAAFATPTVASGSTDVVTIVVRDQAGNAVSGLAGGAFGLALAGGGSGGSFGPVTETATPGTYTSTFTGTAVGTASTLTAAVSGVPLTARPRVQVTAGGVSPANSLASFATPTVAAGAADTVTIVVRDGAANPITGLPGAAFGLALSGGTSTGGFGPVTETATPGTYTATFTGTTAGTASSLTVTVSGTTLISRPTITVTPSGPPAVPVTPGGVSAANSVAVFASPTVALVIKKRGRAHKRRTAVSAGRDVLTIGLRDGAGNPVVGLASGAFGLTLGGGASAGTFGPVTETATPGAYQAVFTATRAGTASRLTIGVKGLALATAPTITVTGSSRRPRPHRPAHHG